MLVDDSLSRFGRATLPGGPELDLMDGLVAGNVSCDASCRSAELNCAQSGECVQTKSEGLY